MRSLEKYEIHIWNLTKKVVEVGSDVTSLQPGQIVGIGWLASTCMNCTHCDSSNDQFCRKKTETITNRDGGFANYIRCAATHAFPIPKELPLEVAGPLLCAGLTVFTPLSHFNIRPGDSVGESKNCYVSLAY